MSPSGWVLLSRVYITYQIAYEILWSWQAMFTALTVLSKEGKEMQSNTSHGQGLSILLSESGTMIFGSRVVYRIPLAEALQFMTGDREYRFEFQPGHSTQPTSLFDSDEFYGGTLPKHSVVLFSGGLDSLTGTINLLENTAERICLVSHQSQPSTIRTQNRLYEALLRYYPDRVLHSKFKCNLNDRRREESQRTRAFLYTSIAFAISQAFEQNHFFLYENGITSINFPRREDLANARASRTTHPKTIYLLQKFFSLFIDKSLQIQTPFLWKTKTEVVDNLLASPRKELLPSAVSCSKTFQNIGEQTHCGGCSQCIDRRFAAYATGGYKWEGSEHLRQEHNFPIHPQREPRNKNDGDRLCSAGQGFWDVEYRSLL